VVGERVEPVLWRPYSLRGTTFRNRAWLSPMCQYSSRDGFPTEWHRTHYPSRAAGGAGLVMFEATAVSPVGRISPLDAGLWSPELAEAYRPITAAVAAAGAVPGVQLAHAGRTASTRAPWHGRGWIPHQEGGWTTIGPSPIPFEGHPAPVAMSTVDIDRLVADFVRATHLAVHAGFGVIELHAAHGYLLHQFLSPLSNRRTDHFGGDPAGRMRLPLAVVDAVRRAWPADRPLFVRVSATDWVEGGWTLAESVVFAKELAARGVDLVDVSSGGTAADATVPVGPRYQVPLAAEIRRQAGVPVGAVGLLETPDAAIEVLAAGDADAVFVGRPMLRDPYWALRAPDAPGAAWPVQYHRAI
jgi:2,4-dienoyl-CoA reductase-like NADH-dependent reductase (Old Yellow Enzyme family)